MTLEEFEEIVEEALEGLPQGLRNKMQNIVVTVEKAPTGRQLKQLKMGKRGLLLGLYEGYPYNKRGHNYSGVMPDRITIFQKPIEKTCDTHEEMLESIRKTVIHEIGHYFGFGERKLRQLGY
ncbi:metallopeptidase family protein [Elusimicrobiota bacterium]